MEKGEDQRLAAQREMLEELGIQVEPTRCVWTWQSPTTDLTLWGWIADLPEAQIKHDPAEVAEVLFLTSEEVANHPDAMPTNKAFIESLKACFSDAQRRGL